MYAVSKGRLTCPVDAATARGVIGPDSGSNRAGRTLLRSPRADQQVPRPSRLAPGTPTRIADCGPRPVTHHASSPIARPAHARTVRQSFDCYTRAVLPHASTTRPSGCDATSVIAEMAPGVEVTGARVARDHRRGLVVHELQTEAAGRDPPRSGLRTTHRLGNQAP